MFVGYYEDTHSIRVHFSSIFTFFVFDLFNGFRYFVYILKNIYGDDAE